MKTVSIIGFGRFGQTLYRLLQDDFSLVLFNRHPAVFEKTVLTDRSRIAKHISEVYDSEVVFFCVPIAAFETVIASQKQYFRADQLLIDVLSVKLYPETVLIKYLQKTKTQALLTHPMFGPDSSKEGFTGLPIVLDRFKTSGVNYLYWKNYFSEKGLTVVEMSAQEHDRLAANSQGVTHFIGRLLEEFKFMPTPIDTLGAKKLHEVSEQTCHDSWELFLNLQNYNPYTRSMRLRLGNSYDRLYNKLLPSRVNSKKLVFGIQGGVGSFNEQAILHYLKNKKIKKYQIKYLYTSKKVLLNLHQGEIDYGLFAIHNSVGGIVDESIEAMADYKFTIVEEIVVPIQHYLMKRKDMTIEKITGIMAHPQVFKQCQSTLRQKFPDLKLVSGSGDLIDTAKAAYALAKGKVPKSTAILGPRRLAELYDLDIVYENLQDDKTNNTSFLLVKR